MADLTATSPFAGARLPQRFAGCTLEALPPAQITAVAPYPGQLAALRQTLGAFPGPGAVIAAAGGRLVWAGHALALAFDADMPQGSAEHAALSDQSDGWAGVSLRGTAAPMVLARLLPLDLRRLPPGSSARSLLGHLPALILRPEALAFELWIWRSMVGSAMHDLTGAMQAVGARQALAEPPTG